MDSDNQPGGGWQYRPQSDNDTDANPFSQTSLTPGLDPQLQSVKTEDRSVSWSASEFIVRDKSFGWYAILGVAAVLLGIVVYLVTADIITVTFIILAALIFGVEAARKPRQIQYEISDGGLTIGNRFFSYSKYRSFSIVRDGAFASLILLPLKRFAPYTSAYIDPKDEDAIIDIIAAHLPIEDRDHDLIDRVMRRIRF